MVAGDLSESALSRLSFQTESMAESQPFEQMADSQFDDQSSKSLIKFHAIPDSPSVTESTPIDATLASTTETTPETFSSLESVNAVNEESATQDIPTQMDTPLQLHPEASTLSRHSVENLAARLREHVMSLGHVESLQPHTPRTTTLRLDPPELGEVLVQMTRESTGIFIRIAAVEPTTQGLLAKHAQELMDSFHDQQAHMNLELGHPSEFETGHSATQHDERLSERVQRVRPAQPTRHQQQPSNETQDKPHDFYA